AGNPVAQESPDWSRFVLGVDELFDQIRDEIRAEDFGADEPDAADERESSLESPVDPISPGSSIAISPPPQTGEPGRSGPDNAGQVDRVHEEAIDEAIRCLGAEPQVRSQPIRRMSLPRLCETETQPTGTEEPISSWVPLVLTAMVVIPATP